MNIRRLIIERDSNKITILALSWRDIESPSRGGAEVQTHNMLSALPRDRYRIIHLSALYEGMNDTAAIDGITYYRSGSMYSVLIDAYLFYRNNHKAIDLVIDQCNTHRFFTPFYVPRTKRIFYIHQMTREIWRVSMRHPLCYIGELSENFITRIYRRGWSITVSESTKKNLLDLGFDEKRIIIVPQILRSRPLPIEQMPSKKAASAFVYVGRYSPYKGIDVAVKALGILKEKYANASLSIIGEYSDTFVESVIKPICEKYHLTIGRYKGGFHFDITCYGFVSEEKKLEVLGSSHALLFPSLREGWGIPISEAAYVGTPSIVFNSDGLRDAVDYGRAGYITEENTAEGLANSMELAIDNSALYEKKRKAAYDFTKDYLGKDYVSELDTWLGRLAGGKK